MVVASVLSFQHLRAYPLPDDGVTWVDRQGPDHRNHVVAAYVLPGGPGDKADIHLYDEVVRIGNTPIRNALDVPQALAPISIPDRTSYTLRRGGIEFVKNNIFIQAAVRDSAVYYQYIVGAAYLIIGLFVYYRRTSASKSLHFFLLCVASVIASCFHYSGKLNTFDEFMYWGNLAATLLAPAISRRARRPRSRPSPRSRGCRAGAARLTRGADLSPAESSPTVSCQQRGRAAYVQPGAAFP